MPRVAKGHIKQLPSGSFRVSAYAGIDPLTRRAIRFKSTAKTEQQARIELGRLLKDASEGRRPESGAAVATLMGRVRRGRGVDVSTRSGILVPGEELPSITEVSVLQGIGTGVIRHALETLAADGLIIVRQGRAAVVAGEPGGDPRLSGRRPGPGHDCRRAGCRPHVCHPMKPSTNRGIHRPRRSARPQGHQDAPGPLARHRPGHLCTDRDLPGRDPGRADHSRSGAARGCVPLLQRPGACPAVEPGRGYPPDSDCCSRRCGRGGVGHQGRAALHRKPVPHRRL